MQAIFGKASHNAVLVILLSVGLTWLRSSWVKLNGGTFVNSLQGVLTKFAEKNPYPWYKSFLLQIAVPNSKVFALLTMWGEFFVAITITLTTVYLLFMPVNKVAVAFLAVSLIGGIFLNLIFWLAAGYTSPSTDSVNLLMIVVQAIGLVYALIIFSASR